MSAADQEKWDRKYRENPALRRKRPPSPLLERYVPARAGAKALDIACGTGRHALYLAKRGWEVDALDLSPVALQILTERMQEEGVRGKITTLLRDLDDYAPEPESYDLIVMANYLDRPLIRRLQSALAPGGLFFLETYLEHPENKKKNANPAFLLRPGELPEIFSEVFKILAYEEFPNKSCETFGRMKAAIAAKKLLIHTRIFPLH